MPHVDGVEHREVVVRGLRLHIAVAGPPTGPPVVLQHGWPQHWYEWRHLFAPLAQAGYRVIAPDFRGFGWSEFPPDEDFRKDTLADDLIALCRELGFEPYTIPLLQPSVTRSSTLLYRNFLTRELPQLLAGRFRGERISVPIRFLVGDRDPLYYDDLVEEQAAHIDDYEGESLSGVGHFIPEEVPDIVRDRVLGFFAAAPAVTASGF
jgi:pimeloyl-ACP methyl ester carboxylesterase